MKQDIELHIEELVLHGFSGYNKYQIGEAVQREIERLLQERGLRVALYANANIGQLRANIILHSNSKIESIGNSIAGSIYKILEK